ncbi:MAG: M20/M25/M40 family metallo-hydrolase, partial [Miltoncostaeaceae bacterium]
MATTARLRVDIERLKADVLALGEIGRDPDDRGIYRMAFTEADMLGRHWLMDRAAATGLAVAMDGAGNVHARLGAADGSAVVIGSHTDTVPRAGMLDGALGVLCGLECLRVLAGAGITPATAIELISFSDEEGRFGGMLGSEALCGFLTPESLHLVGQDGVPLA